MLMMEYFGKDYSRYQAGILATDISEKALNLAMKGCYNFDKIHNLPENLTKKYFHKIKDDEWEVNETVKKEVTYRRFNLMNETFPFRKQFDAIFCRNVMIYFDETTRETLVQKLYDLTVPNGYLFIGHSESLKRDRTPYKYLMPAVYQKI
jgi:chemotaxis protein methyltransferase CheR